MDFKTAVRQVLAEEMRGQKSAGDGGDTWRYGQKHDVTSFTGASTGPGFLHGPGGLLTWPGVDQRVYSTLISASGELFSQIPWKPSSQAHPLFEVLTGMTAGSGAVKDAPCDEAPIGGLIKAGMLTAPFGRIAYQTRPIDITRVGLVNDRADPMDLVLANKPEYGWIPPVNGPSLTSEFGMAIYGRNLAMQQEIARQMFAGNPTNNSANDGYKEMRGLDLLIQTGHVDAITGSAIPAVDSYVRDLNYARVDATGVIDRIMAYMTDMFRQLVSRAALMRLLPVRWAVVMREEMFYAITALWPCRYYLGGCTVTDSAGQRVNIDAKDQTELRDTMRREKFLLVDGVRWDIMFDRTPEDTGNNSGGNFPRGCFNSDIYIVPMSVLGGQSVLFGEYADMRNAQIAAIAQDPLVMAKLSPNGEFIEFGKQTNACITIQIEMQPRLILRTPWLAGRITNIVYCPVQHSYDPFPTDAYPTEGGVTTRPGPSYYGDGVD